VDCGHEWPALSSHGQQISQGSDVAGNDLFSGYSSVANVSTMRRPLGTYLARPSGHDSFSKGNLIKDCIAEFVRDGGDIICCQMLWRHSLDSVDEAVSTIRR